MIASIVWERTMYAPYPGLRDGDTAAIVATAETATRMRHPVVVVCKRCGAWLVVVHEYADDERTVGAFLVVREKHAEMVRRVQPEHAFIADTSSSTLSQQQKQASVHVPLDATTSPSLPTWCPKDGPLTAMSTAAIRSALDTAQRTDTARTVRHY